MTAIDPFTLQDIMDAIYVAVDNDPTSSLTQDDEYTSRLRLCNMAIATWMRQDVLWNELWKTYTHNATVSSSTITLTMTDMRMPGSWVRFQDSNGNIAIRLDVIKPFQAANYTAAGRQAVYFTGNQSAGWTMNFTVTPASGDNVYGNTPIFDYYKSPTRLVNTTDVPEMSNPFYIVHFVSYRKNLYNGRSNVAQDDLASAQDCMDNMKISNAMNVHYSDQEIEDVEIIRTNSSLGN